MKMPPEGSIPCNDPDPVTEHWPHWVKVEEQNLADRWFVNALRHVQNRDGVLPDEIHEAIGPHFQSNPYNLKEDTLVRYGTIEIDLPDHSFERIRRYLIPFSVVRLQPWKTVCT